MGQSLTTSYLLDGQSLLSATADGQSTFYLPGVGEKKQDWSYYLADGTNSVRQLTNAEGVVTLTRSFTPWGELLEQEGAGDFTWGYLGGVLDAASGLVYVGNGQYYDPATGRFLSRGVNPATPNPYVPWQGNPLGMIVGPLALMAMLCGKRKAGKVDQVLVVVIVALAMGVTLSGCNLTTQSQTTASPSTATSTSTVTLDPGPSQTGGQTGGGTATQPPTQTLLPPTPCTPTPTRTGTPTPTLTMSVRLSSRAEDLRDWALELGYSAIDILAMILQRESLNAWMSDQRHVWFTGEEKDPAKIFKEATTRWFWSWIKDASVINIYGQGIEDVDREAMVFNWIVPAMQSEDNLNKELMITYHTELKEEFKSIAKDVIYPSVSGWMIGDGMWSWANAYLYESIAWPILDERARYRFPDNQDDSDNYTRWYIIDADTLRAVCKYNTNPAAKCVIN